MTQPSAGVDEDVVAVVQSAEHVREVLRFGGTEAVDAGVAGDDREPLGPLVDGVLDGGVAGQYVVERRAVGVDTQRVAEVRHPEVAVDDRDRQPRRRECRPQIHRRRRLSDTALRARDRVDSCHS